MKVSLREKSSYLTNKIKYPLRDNVLDLDLANHPAQRCEN